MKKMYFLFIAIFTINIATAQQFSLIGDASASSTPGCYTLTNAPNQAGAVLGIYAIDLTQPFDVMLTLNFGNRPDSNYTIDTLCGGSGMSFILLPIANPAFISSSGMGFHGISTSLGVLMDTYSYDDSTDPPYEHISINQNGDETHTTFTPSGVCPAAGGTVTVINPNELVPYCNAVGLLPTFTDGLDHLFRFTWTPATMTINAYLGTATSLPPTPTITYTGNIVNNIFGGDPNVNWVVAASTGSCWNVQTVCATTIANFTCDTVVCAGQPITFFDNSVSGLPIVTYSWDFGDASTGYTDTITHTYNAPGTYPVNLFIMNSGGISSEITHDITVYPLPATPGLISGSNNVLAGQQNVLYSVPLVANATSYSWELPLGAIGSSNTNTINVNFSSLAHNGIIEVKGHNNCGDGNYSSLYVTVHNNIDINVYTGIIYIYPSPVSLTATITYLLKVDQKFTLDIYDITGRKMKELVNSCQQLGEHHITLDASELTQGIYFLKATGDDNFETIKFSVIH